MKRNKEFENILDDCLQRILEGESVEACLEWYPDQAEELRPLLLTAAGARRAVEIRPRHEFRDRAGYEFQKAIQEAPPVARREGFFEVLMKPAWATILIVFIILVAGTGTIAAANNSLPGDALYSVKMATESVRLTFAFSEEGKADLYVKLADRRVDEIVKMAEKGKAEQVETTTDKLEEHLLAMAGLGIVGGAEMLETQIARLDAAAAPAESFGAEQAPVVVPVPTEPEEDYQTSTEEATPPPPALTGPKAAGEPDEEGDMRANQTEVWSLEGEQSELKVAVANSAIMNSQALNSLLDDADEEMRVALNRAIEVLNAGYINIISNLD
jgi:hypothetical protein